MLRRSLLTAGLTAGAVGFAMPRVVFAGAEPGADRQVLHVLDRLAFGASQADVERVKAIGIEGYVAEQLKPVDAPEGAALGERLAALDTLKMNPVRLWQEYGPLRPAEGVKPSPEEIKARRQRANIIVEQARAARLWRALYSPRQLNEVMVDFWYNHFNVFAGKGLDHLWVGAYEAEAIRPHALGRFRDLLGATAHHPAMLFYLDNAQNTAPGFKTPDGRELGINENYARELMELHTLGVDGGYTQDDVVALARILTGWSLLRPNAPHPNSTGFMFYPRRHDDGSKHFLGQDIAASGEAEGERALDMLAKTPATALHISRKLAEYFVADSAPPALVESLARRFQETDGDIPAVLGSLFASRDFNDSVGGKFKSPYRYVVSAVRASGAAVENPRALLGAMARQGQPLYGCPTPDGYRDSEAAWLSPDATMLRVSFATALGAGRLPLRGAPPAEQQGTEAPVVEASVQVPAPLDAAPLEAMLAPSLSEHTRRAVAAASPGLRAALILGSPDFMRR